MNAKSNGSPILKHSLASLIDRKKIEDGVWIEYKNTGFEVKVAYYGKPQMEKLFEVAKRKRIETRTLREVEELDKVAFQDVYAEYVIRDWKGLSVKALNELVVVDVEVVGDMPENFELECTHENKLALLQNSVEFDQWLGAVCADVAAFNKAKKEALEKNFLTTQSGSG